MPEEITVTHVRILEERIARVRSGGEDRTFCIRLYEQHRDSYRSVGKKLIDEMLVNVERLYRLLLDADRHTLREVAIATAALLYFLEDDDHIPDDYGFPGLVDDALVVRAACREIGDALPEA